MFENIGRFFKRLRNEGNTFIAARTSDEFLLQKTDFGRVTAETATIQRVAERAVSSVEGINQASATVDRVIQNSPLKIRFNLDLAQNYSVNDVSKDLVAVVRKELQEIFSVVEVEIYVRVTNVTQAEKKRKRRVR